MAATQDAWPCPHPQTTYISVSGSTHATNIWVPPISALLVVGVVRVKITNFLLSSCGARLLRHQESLITRRPYLWSRSWHRFAISPLSKISSWGAPGPSRSILCVQKSINQPLGRAQSLRWTLIHVPTVQCSIGSFRKEGLHIFPSMSGGSRGPGCAFLVYLLPTISHTDEENFAPPR